MRGITMRSVVAIFFFLTIPALAAEKGYEQLYRKGVEFNKKGNYVEAIRYYSQAISLKNDSAELYFVRGRAFRQSDRLDEAISDLTKALKLRPAYAEAYNHRGVTYIGKGDLRAAKSDFEKACGMGHKDACANLKQLRKEQR